MTNIKIETEIKVAGGMPIVFKRNNEKVEIVVGSCNDTFFMTYEELVILDSAVEFILTTSGETGRVKTTKNHIAEFKEKVEFEYGKVVLHRYDSLQSSKVNLTLENVCQIGLTFEDMKEFIFALESLFNDGSDNNFVHEKRNYVNPFFEYGM